MIEGRGNDDDGLVGYTQSWIGWRMIYVVLAAQMRSYQIVLEESMSIKHIIEMEEILSHYARG